MKNLFLITIMMSVLGIKNGLIAQSVDQETAEEQYLDPNFEDSYEDSDVETASPQPEVSWPGRDRDPFYEQLTGITGNQRG